jgi:hypothetical protein
MVSLCPQEEFKAFQVCLQKNPEHLAKIMAADEVALAAEQAEAEGGGKETASAEAGGQQQQPQQHGEP